MLSKPALAAAPWFLPVIGLATVARFGPPELLQPVALLCALSMVMVSPFQFSRDLGSRPLGSTFATTWLLVAVPCSLLWAACVPRLGLPQVVQLEAMGLGGLLSTTLVLVIVMGQIRPFGWLLGRLGVGGLLAALAMQLPGEAAILAGLALSLAVTAALLLGALLAALPRGRGGAIWDNTLVPRPYPALAGLCYALGLGAHKLVHRSSDYELAFWLAQLTAVVGSALFLGAAENDFGQRLRDFQVSVRTRRSLSEIREARTGMEEGLWRDGARLLRVQGVVTLVTWLLAPELFREFHPGPAAIYLVRLQMSGVLLQTLMFMGCVVLLQLELHAEALSVLATFLGSNLALTLALRQLGGADGLSFDLACALGAGLALYWLRVRLPRMDQLLFQRTLRLPHSSSAVGIYTYRKGPGR